MKLIVTYEIEDWLGYTHKYGCLYRHKAVMFKPLDIFRDFTPYLLMEYDCTDKGYGKAIRISKPVNNIHDTFMGKFWRMKAKL